MQTLWAPWRMEYIGASHEKGCLFCRAEAGADDLTLLRGAGMLVLMNRYPYTNGHLLVAPARHVADLDQLQAEEICDLMRLTEKSVGLLRRTLKPDGFNIGLNLGQAAGAGIADHLHLHVVPRWAGDANFMAVCADIRVVSEHIRVTFDRLAPAFQQI